MSQQGCMLFRFDFHRRTTVHLVGKPRNRGICYDSKKHVQKTLGRISKRQQKKEHDLKNTPLKDDYCQATMRIHALFKEEEVYVSIKQELLEIEDSFDFARDDFMSTCWSLVGTPNFTTLLSPLVCFVFLFGCNSGRCFAYDFIKGCSLMFTLRFIFTLVFPNDRFCFPGLQTDNS